MRLCQEAEIEGVMVSSDKDFMQLITEEIVMLNHHNERVGIPEVYEKFGCAPEQVIEKLQVYQSLGVDQFIYYASMGLDKETQKHSLDLFIKEVMPAFQE